MVKTFQSTLQNAYLGSCLTKKKSTFSSINCKCFHSFIHLFSIRSCYLIASNYPKVFKWYVESAARTEAQARMNILLENWKGDLCVWSGGSLGRVEGDEAEE